MQKLRWVKLILPDDDIRVASLNRLRDLALDFIIVIFLRDANIKNAHAARLKHLW